MRCETTRLNLKALHDGELARLDAWRVQRHVQRCARCAEELASLRRLNDLLLSSDIVEHDPSQEAATPIPAPVPPPQERKHARGPGVSKGARNRTPQLIGGVVTAALAVSLVAPSLVNQKKSMAAEVRAALQEVNTWHLSGWKLIDGERVRWEVWVRRDPFFYREQIGEQMTLNDGTQRVQVIPADQKSGRSQGIVLRTASVPEPQNMGWSYTAMISSWRGAREPWKETLQEAIFNQNEAGMQGPDTVTDKLYTVDKRTWLPVRFEVRRGRSGSAARVTAEFLRAEYDMPLPTAVTAPRWPKGSFVVDTMNTAADPNLPRQNVASAGGLTAQVMPLAMDADGNVLVRVRGWLGNVPLRRGVPMYLNVSPPLSTRSRAKTRSPTRDDANRAYVLVHLDALDAGRRDGDHLLLFVPVEPLEKVGSLPRTLTISPTIAPTVMRRVSGVRNLVEGYFLFEQHFTWTVALPEKAVPAPMDVDAYLTPGWRDRIVGTDTGVPLEAAAAAWRPTTTQTWKAM